MKKIATGVIGSLFVLASSALPAFAEETTFKFPRGNLFVNLGDILKNLLIILFVFAGILAFVFIVVGGIQWITAGGDKQAAQGARDRITAAVVGLVIVVAAFALTIIVTSALGIDIFRTGGVTLPSANSVFNE